MRWVYAVLLVLYELATVATFVKISFFDGVDYNWWNWVLILPINVFLAQMWPIYWLIIRPFFAS